MTDWRAIPPSSGDHFAPRYVYLCRFASVAKVGVTTTPAKRIKALASKHGEPVQAIVLLVGYFEACRREAAIARAFGAPTRQPGRRSEFFAPAHFAAASVMVATPTPEFRKDWLRSEANRQRCEARYAMSKAA